MPSDPTLSNEEVIRSFSCYQGGTEEGYLIDFLGTRTRIAYLAAVKGWKPRVEGYPIPANYHATALEWAGSLRAVLEARGKFVIAELGAGWGPWLVAMAAAARQRGIRDLALIGVEGSKAHCDYMRTHFLDNGLNPDEHALLHGIVGGEDGFAEFPVLEKPDADYGAVAVFAPPPLPATIRQKAKATVKWLLGRTPSPQVPAGPGCPTERVRSYSVATVLAEYPRVDLLHIDIQGHEVDLVAASRSVLKKKVRRMVIGTHGRLIEEQLLNELSAQGWVIEGEEACMYRQNGGSMALYRDGCQVWSNPALALAGRAAA